MDKRSFIKKVVGGSCGIWMGNFIKAQNMPDRLWKWSHESFFYKVVPRGVKCTLCPNECIIREGASGTCHNRVNYRNKLYSIAYGNPCAVHVDPIEKKPLFHFFPGSRAFSLATAGCNFACLNCQNWEISQVSPKETQNMDLMPEEVVKQCLANKCESIAYTYTEPTSFYEYVYDTAALAHQQGIKNVFISNGYINPDPLKKLIPFLDAANIDLKSFSEDIYVRLNGGKLNPVLNTLKTIKDSHAWLEITNLIIPSWTDDFDMIKRMCEWLVTNGFSDTPLHFSRFFPMYKLSDLSPTSSATLSKAADIAKKAGLKYVYIGNLSGKDKGENTLCPSCKKTIIEREGYAIRSYHIKEGKCAFCHTPIAGRWK